MAQYKKKQPAGISDETVAESEAMAKATQRPGQTKEQTKLIAQGIQKGIDEYKKRQKGKARDLDKKLKKVKNQANQTEAVEVTDDETPSSSRPLPWILLGLSWVGFAVYITISTAG